MPLEFSPYVCIRKPLICNVFRPRVTWVGAATCTYKRDDLYPICSKCNIASLLALYGSTMPVALSPGIIPIFAVLHTEKLAFLLSVSVPCYIQKMARKGGFIQKILHFLGDWEKVSNLIKGDFQFHFSMKIWTVVGFNHKLCTTATAAQTAK